jgi:hypothetical protein
MLNPNIVQDRSVFLKGMTSKTKMQTTRGNGGELHQSSDSQVLTDDFGHTTSGNQNSLLDGAVYHKRN